MKTIRILVIIFCVFLNTFNIFSNIKGNWYYIDSDSSYNEVYINDSLITSCSENYGMDVNRFYYSSGDTIYVILNDSVNIKWEITHYYEKNSVKILYLKNEIILYPLNIDNINAFDVNNKNELLKFLEMFYDRVRKFKNSRENIKNN